MMKMPIYIYIKCKICISRYLQKMENQIQIFFLILHENNKVSMNEISHIEK